PRKDEEVWFEDGNLILATATVQFRVYRGLLVRHSLVFKDMLSLPQPPDSDALPKCTQCVPVITIPVADSPQDLRHFLKALTGNCLLYVTEDGMHPTYHEISSLIRMSHKYQCETILERCMKYMSSFYHDDFELWRNDEEVFSPPGFERIHSIGVVNLARLVGADKWLPGALMGCCMLGAELIDGFQREDGTRETLSLDDLGRCYLGRANLVEANATATLKLLRQTLSPDCRRPERCEPTLRQLLGDLADIEQHKKTVFNLRWDWSWTPYVDRQDVERELCWECYRMLGKHGRQKEIHAEIYERLPEMMGVKVERWGVPDPAPQPEEAPQDDAVGAAPTPAPPAGGIPVPPLVIPPPQPIIIQPPQNAPPPPPLPPPIVIPPAMHVVIPPPLMAQGHWQAPPPPPVQPAVPVVIIPPAAPGP
ncbi:hypothetical protein L226DRAFT_459128, partial [Lentinus tigrinus ALCF2SS1-7]|uniref:uncharacterized protein n=1 Tax=Lentinus tigrinus ALCF2SS1-7 TaxID=1328758 RepID=UPI0011660A66